MKLLRVHVISAKTCGGMLDGLDLTLRSAATEYSQFDPLCFVGPNGAGKSQFLQILAEMFQSIFHACIPTEERSDINTDVLFQLEYLIRPPRKRKPIHVRVSRMQESSLAIETSTDGEWKSQELDTLETLYLLPTKLIAYTSGGNETLSLPFLVSRSGYASDVADRALNAKKETASIPDTRLMLIDYGTNLEVLTANLLLGTVAGRHSLLEHAKLTDIHSFRCIIQLAHKAVPKRPKGVNSKRKGVQLTPELELQIDRLRKCATCHSYDEDSEVYTFDYLVLESTRAAFRFFWSTALELYNAFHKFAMLNDLAISRTTRRRFKKDTKLRRFASRLPEPQDEEKVFRFESVQFVKQKRSEPVDYVALSDGEHQLAQLLGTMSMISFPGAIFILDEPESHFNPKWRVKCISSLLDVPTLNGPRRNGPTGSNSAEQECILTTHSPFVPSDMHRDRVFIFSKSSQGLVEVRHPNIETYGATFDTIVEECFDVRPPISQKPLDELDALRESKNANEIADAIAGFGDSVEKAILLDRVRQLRKK
jgi:restriction system-associated AAA family ATPase